MVETWFEWSMWLYAVVCVATIVPLLFISAPYGRHQRAGWGPTMSARLGWIVMESPAVLAFGLFFFLGDNIGELVPLILLCVWQLHYIRRSFIYPFFLRIDGKTMPVLIAAMAFVYNILNALVNATWISTLGSYETSWLADPRFLIGAALFAFGMWLNISSDAILRALRAPGETGYKIPRRGLYRWVSSPNYLGEMVEWLGWAVMTWSISGLAFFIYTVANLGPRAFANHRWYQETFEDYPKERRALIPFLL